MLAAATAARTRKSNELQTFPQGFENGTLLLRLTGQHNRRPCYNWWANYSRCESESQSRRWWASPPVHFAGSCSTVSTRVPATSTGRFTWRGDCLAHQNPYDTPLEQYPLPAALFALPFLRIAPEIAAGIFYGISSALLALGLTRESYRRSADFSCLSLLGRRPHRAMAAHHCCQRFLSDPAARHHDEAASRTACFPHAAVSPRTPGLPLRGSVKLCRDAAMAAVVAPANALLRALRSILIFPGPLLLLALLRYRDRDAWLLLLAAIMPQRWFFDSFTLWLIPKSRREILLTAFLSWGSWHLALVPPTRQLHRSRQTGRHLPLPAYAGGCAIAERTSATARNGYPMNATLSTRAYSWQSSFSACSP